MRRMKVKGLNINVYWCPCCSDVISTKCSGTLNNHFKRENMHSVTDLLEAGVSAWSFRQENHEDLMKSLNWLFEKRYLVEKEDEDDDEIDGKQDDENDSSYNEEDEDFEEQLAEKKSKAKRARR